MTRNTEQQIVALFVQAMRTALALVDSQTTVEKLASVTISPGIYSHQSKYNPWRAYVWDKAHHKTVYIGAFPTINKAKAAQRAFREGRPITSGTRAALRLVA